MRGILAAFMVIGLGLVSLGGRTASFDCSKSSTSVEKLICSDNDLSILDETLATVYRVRRAEGHSESSLVRDQLAWLSERNICQDRECIKASYERRLADLRGRAVAREANPLKIIAQFEDYKPTDYPIQSVGGRLVFSQYDKSGNNFDIVSYDIEDQSSQYVLRGRYGAQFIAQDAKFLIVSEKGRNANPLVVIDRVTGKHVRQIRLRHQISWAHIFDNRLVAIQGPTLGSGYSAKTTALIFDLPSLKIIQSKEIVGGNDADVWKGKILSLGHDLGIYDTQLNEVALIKLPPRKTGTGVSCAATTPLRVYGDKAIIVSNCGETLIYDLKRLQLERTIGAYSHFYAVAVMDGLIFTAPTSEPRQRDNAHVFDIASGQEVAVLPIDATDLFVKGNRLLAVERQFAKPSPMTLYEIDTGALRRGDWQTAGVVVACRNAQVAANDPGNLYAAIDLCKASGIEGFVGKSELPSDIVPLMRDYALWLSQTLDLYLEAIKLLEKLQEHGAEPALARALAEARLKSRVLEGKAIGAPTALEGQTSFAKALALDRSRLITQSKAIEFGAFSNLFHFSGDRVYVGRYGCSASPCQDSGASLGVFDRATLEQIGSVSIAPDDDQFQDGISSIASDNNHIYVSVEYRYEESERTNFVTVDKASLEVVQKGQVREGVQTLVAANGELLSCTCHPTVGGGRGCKLLNPKSLKTAEKPGKICVRGEPPAGYSVIDSPDAPSDAHYFDVATKDYLIAEVHGSGHESYVFRAKTEGIPSAPRKAGVGVSSAHPVDGTNALISVRATRGGQRILFLDVPTGSIRTLLGLPTTQSRLSIIATHQGMLLVGLGRDLLVYDLKNYRLLRYIKDFIPNGFKDNGHGLDANRIARLIVDGNQVIALTFHGQNSQLMRLQDLKAFVDERN